MGGIRSGRSSSRRAVPRSGSFVRTHSRTRRAYTETPLDVVAAASAEDHAWELLIAIAGAHAQGDPKSCRQLECLVAEAVRLLATAPVSQVSIDKVASVLSATTGFHELDNVATRMVHEIHQPTSLPTTTKAATCQGKIGPVDGNALDSTEGPTAGVGRLAASCGRLKGAIEAVGAVMEVIAAAAADEPLPASCVTAMQDQDRHAQEGQAATEWASEEEEEEDGRCIIV